MMPPTITVTAVNPINTSLTKLPSKLYLTMAANAVESRRMSEMLRKGLLLRIRPFFIKQAF
jgi:hypothetical protein